MNRSTITLKTSLKTGRRNEIERRSLGRKKYGLAALMLASLLMTQSGCMGLYANLMHAVGADQVPAEYDELPESRLAVVTLTDSSQYSDDVSARLLSRMVGDILLKEVDDVKLVREDQIDQWRDTNGWDSVDLGDIGRGVKADKVLGIELTNLRLREGQTLYRGRANVAIKIIDPKTDDILYRRTIDEFTYPTTAGQHTSETTEKRFRKLYLGMLARQIARSFHPWDMTEDFALDSVIASQ